MMTEVAGVARRPVVIVPGFAGSNLWRGNEQIWPVPRKVLAHPELLRLEQPLEAKGLVGRVVLVPHLLKWDQYRVLLDYLKDDLGYRTNDDLLEFGYDFRQDNRTSAERLAEAIEGWNATSPVTVVAHSMGCLVARYYIEHLDGKSRVERVILLGGPHRGAPYAAMSLLKGPDLLPLGLMNGRLRDVLAEYPSWYQILPLDLLSEESWLPEAQRPLMRRAHAFRVELGHQSSVPTVCVFGCGFKTIAGVTMRRGSDRGVRATDVVFASGDGMIPEASAVMPGSQVHAVRQRHRSLCMDNDVKARLKLELTR